MMLFNMNQLSRREFVALTAGAPLASMRQTALQATGLTAQDVIDQRRRAVLGA
jgi:hypothetical protein